MVERAQQALYSRPPRADVIHRANRIQLDHAHTEDQERHQAWWIETTLPCQRDRKHQRAYSRGGMEPATQQRPHSSLHVVAALRQRWYMHATCPRSSAHLKQNMRCVSRIGAGSAGKGFT